MVKVSLKIFPLLYYSLNKLLDKVQRKRNIYWVIYFHGEGIPQDIIQAARWYQKAALQGEQSAYYHLGEIYYQAEEFEEAKKWLLKAAEQGVLEAQKKLGYMYYQGEGSSQRFTDAFKWSLKAAEQGDAEAQNNVALMYFKGEGVRKDYVLSYQWVSLSAAQDNAEAIKARDFFASKLSPSQIAEGERLAQEWLEKKKTHGLKATSVN